VHLEDGAKGTAVKLLLHTEALSDVRDIAADVALIVVGPGARFRRSPHALPVFVRRCPVVVPSPIVAHPRLAFVAPPARVSVAVGIAKARSSARAASAAISVPRPPVAASPSALLPPIPVSVSVPVLVLVALSLAPPVVVPVPRPVSGPVAISLVVAPATCLSRQPAAQGGVTRNAQEGLLDNLSTEPVAIS